MIFTRTDNIDMNNLRARVSNAACSTGGPMATPAYAGESATFINQLAEDSCKYVFILADTPGGAVNGDVATVLLTVKPSVAGTSGATVEAPTGAADVAGTVEAVYAETGPTTGTSTGNVDKDGVSFAYDQYVVGTLNVKKTAAVISDGFSPAGQAKAIPGAIVEYTITVQNNGLATTAATLTRGRSDQHHVRRRLDHARTAWRYLTSQVPCRTSARVRSIPRARRQASGDSGLTSAAAGDREVPRDHQLNGQTEGNRRNDA